MHIYGFVGIEKVVPLDEYNTLIRSLCCRCGLIGWNNKVEIDYECYIYCDGCVNLLDK